MTANAARVLAEELTLDTGSPNAASGEYFRRVTLGVYSKDTLRTASGGLSFGLCRGVSVLVVTEEVSQGVNMEQGM